MRDELSDERLEDLSDENQQIIMSPDIKTEKYDRILKKSKEFMAAGYGLGPYVGFGLSNLHGILTIAIG